MYLNQVLSIWFVIMCSVRYSLWKVFFRFSVCVRFRSPTNTGLTYGSVCGVWMFVGGCVCVCGGGGGIELGIGLFRIFRHHLFVCVNTLSLVSVSGYHPPQFVLFELFYFDFFSLSLHFGPKMHNTRTCIVLVLVILIWFVYSRFLFVCLSLPP